MTEFQIIIIDDDPEMASRPLYEELVDKYGKETIVWIDDPDNGLLYVKEHLTQKTIVILDYDFGSKRKNGLALFQELQEESALLYIILNTAKDIEVIPYPELKSFINNHIMALVDKTDGYMETLKRVEYAISYLNNRVDCILEEWILRHEFFTREKPYIRDDTGKSISMNDVLNEIRRDSDFGRKMSSNIISTAISLLKQDIDKIDKQ